MRHSLLSRSAVAVASLAIGSAALAAVPASAAPAASALGVTQDQVLTAANGLRAANAADTDVSKAADRALYALVSKVCDVDSTQGESAYLLSATPVTTPGNADGVQISASTYNSGLNNNKACTFAAFASTVSGFQLSGTATITAETTVRDEVLGRYVTSPYKQVSSLSGDAFTTPAIVTPQDTLNGQPANVVASAAGNATKTSTVVTSTKVKDKKSKSEKKAAKKKFEKRLAQAKKNYSKALDKADSSKSKKAAAKRVYAKARSLAKAKYKYATAGYKIVKKKSTVSDVRAFDITTAAPAPPVMTQN
jgi:hypothetical protein